MKQLLALFAFCAVAIPLLGATSGPGDPVVVVYPLTVTGATDAQAGGKIAVLYAARLGTLGGVAVKAPLPGTNRQHFLDAAREAGADYYITGYITPLGNAVTLINQVVSTHSGIQVWSDSVQVGSYNEASSQADAIRAAILRHAGRYSIALEATPPPAPLTAATVAQKNEANLNTLFQKRPAPGASPAGDAAAPAVAQAGSLPAAGISADEIQVAVAHVIGTADLAAKYHADNQLSLELTKRVTAPTLIDAQTSDFALQGAQICLVNALRPTARVFGGTLALTRIDPGFSNYALAKFDLIVYDCEGNVVAKQHSEFRSIGRTADDLALDGAIKETFDAVLPSKTGKKRR
jgi:hypothetical protein